MYFKKLPLIVQTAKLRYSGWHEHNTSKISILLPLLAAFILLSSCEDATAEEEKSPEIVYLHPEFTMTIEDLEEMTAPLPEAIRQAILAKPQDFLELVLKVSEEPEILTILVDKNHALPEEWEPEDRVSLNDYPLAVSRKDLSLSKAVMPHVLALNDAAKADGVTLLFPRPFVPGPISRACINVM